MTNFEPEILPRLKSDTLVAGVDEVGRGSLFGPVVAAVVVIPFADFGKLENIGVKDSKKLTPKKRFQLSDLIKQTVTDFQISLTSVREIDQINILQASLLAMKKAIYNLTIQPEFCLVDGNKKIPNLIIPQETLVKGDQRSPVIAAASILAKVWRDQLIIELAEKYPEYDLKANKGYGTKKHLLALEKYGITPEHRRSFRPCSEIQLNLKLADN
jgi:ribonuclease HII